MQARKSMLPLAFRPQPPIRRCPTGCGGLETKDEKFFAAIAQDLQLGNLIFAFGDCALFRHTEHPLILRRTDRLQVFPATSGRTLCRIPQQVASEDQAARIGAGDRHPQKMAGTLGTRQGFTKSERFKAIGSNIGIARLDKLVS